MGRCDIPARMSMPTTTPTPSRPRQIKMVPTVTVMRPRGPMMPRQRQSLHCTLEKPSETLPNSMSMVLMFLIMANSIAPSTRTTTLRIMPTPSCLPTRPSPLWTSRPTGPSTATRPSIPIGYSMEMRRPKTRPRILAQTHHQLAVDPIQREVCPAPRCMREVRHDVVLSAEW